MAISTAFNDLRTVQDWNNCGLLVSFNSNEVATALDATIRQIVTFTDYEPFGGLEGTMKILEKNGKGEALPTAFLLTYEKMNTNASVRNDKFREKVEATEALLSSNSTANERERKHLKAAMLYARGEIPAAQNEWESILDEFPTDLMALKFAHDSYFFSGSPEGKRDCVQKVLDKWKDAEPCKSFVHGMLAFGHQECMEYEDAERHARKAIAGCPKDVWAIHAMVHVYEMTGRSKEGKQFLEEGKNDWNSSKLACHLYVHNALFSIDDGDIETAMAIWDRECLPRAQKSLSIFDFADAASILMRLEVEGADVGDRWKKLPDVKESMKNHGLAFADVHYAFVLPRIGRRADLDVLVASIDAYLESAPEGFARTIYEMAGSPLCRALAAQADKDYDTVVNFMLPLIVTDAIQCIAGTRSQLDVFAQILIHACMNSGNKDHLNIARIILNQRDTVRNGSTSGVSERIRRTIESAEA